MLSKEEIEKKVAELAPKIRRAKSDRERRMLFTEVAKLRVLCYEFGLKPFQLDTSYLKEKRSLHANKTG